MEQSFKYHIIRHNLFSPHIIKRFMELPTLNEVKRAVESFDFIKLSDNDAQLILEGDHVRPSISSPTYFIEENLKC